MALNPRTILWLGDVWGAWRTPINRDNVSVTRAYCMHIITQQDWSVGTPCCCIEEKECSFPSSKKLYNSATSCALNGVVQFSNAFILHSWSRPLRVSNGLQIEWNPLKSQTLGSCVLAMPSGELEDVSGNQQFWLWANPLIANSNWRMICVGVFIIKMYQACSVPPADFLLPVSDGDVI